MVKTPADMTVSQVKRAMDTDLMDKANAARMLNFIGIPMLLTAGEADARAYWEPLRIVGPVEDAIPSFGITMVIPKLSQRMSFLSLRAVKGVITGQMRNPI
jgi:hypothetical protein